MGNFQSLRPDGSCFLLHTKAGPDALGEQEDHVGCLQPGELQTRLLSRGLRGGSLSFVRRVSFRVFSEGENGISGHVRTSLCALWTGGHFFHSGSRFDTKSVLLQGTSELIACYQPVTKL